MNDIYQISSPPSELKKFYNKKPNNRKMKKSKKVFLTPSGNVINCHQCNKSNIKYDYFKCSHNHCKNYYCFKCVKKYPVNNISIPMNENVPCYACRQLCTCLNCKSDNDKNKTLKTKSPIRNIFKIDDFIIEENYYCGEDEILAGERNDKIINNNIEKDKATTNTNNTDNNIISTILMNNYNNNISDINLNKVNDLLNKIKKQNHGSNNNYNSHQNNLDNKIAYPNLNDTVNNGDKQYQEIKNNFIKNTSTELPINNNSTDTNGQMSNIIEDLKKQFFSIQYYALLQKLFISYIFRNVEIYADQINKNFSVNNDILDNLINSLPKLLSGIDSTNDISFADNLGNPNLFSIKQLKNNLIDKLNQLKNKNNTSVFLTKVLNMNIDSMKTNGVNIFKNADPVFENISNMNNNKNEMNENKSKSEEVNKSNKEFNLDSFLSNFPNLQNPGFLKSNFLYSNNSILSNINNPFLNNDLCINNNLDFNSYLLNQNQSQNNYNQNLFAYLLANQTQSPPINNIVNQSFNRQLLQNFLNSTQNNNSFPGYFDNLSTQFNNLLNNNFTNRINSNFDLFNQSQSKL